MTMTADPTEAPVAADLPVLIGLVELVALVPYTKQAVYRWRVKRSPTSKPALPDPLLVVSGTPMWSEATILEFARSRGIPVDRAELRKIRKAQGK